MTVAAVVLAAGAGTRFGESVKQLHPVAGVPMLERVLAVVAEAGVEQRVVVLGANAAQVLDAIDRHGAHTVVCDRWREGQAASLRAGLGAVDAAAALIVLGDGPGLDPQAIERVISAWRAEPAQAHAADYGSGRSHPVVLPRALWSLLPARGEAPGRSIAVRLVDCGDLPHPGDIDYPA